MTAMALHGVHHTARPTWKLKETVEFYRDKLGLKLVHAISARGWGPIQHPDFLHFFFESGRGSTIAFFYYIGHAQPEYLRAVDCFDYDAIHTAWSVETEAELVGWKDALKMKGVEVVMDVQHELIRSIYMRDPNGYLVEITFQNRPFTPLDHADAARTITAAIAMEERERSGGEKFAGIEAVWNEKANRLDTEVEWV